MAAVSTNPVVKTTPATTAPATTPPEADPDSIEGQPIKGFWANLSRAAALSGMVAEDMVRETVDERPLTTVGIGGGGSLAVASFLGLRNAEQVGGFTASTFAQTTGKQFVINGIRITPTLAAGILGPAVADGVSFLSPKFLPKYKKGAKNKAEIQIKRAVVGAVTVGALAGAVWLIKPSFLKSAGFISDNAISGFTRIATESGEQMLRFGAAVPESARVIESVAPMARNATFSNRLLVGALGGTAAAILGSRAIAGDKDEKLKYGTIALGVGAATAAAVVAMPHITRGASLLPEGLTFWKPNKQFFKEAGKIVVPTGGAGGTAAYTYFDIMSDFDTIISPRSPFRKGK